MKSWVLAICFIQHYLHIPYTTGPITCSLGTKVLDADEPFCFLFFSLLFVPPLAVFSVSQSGALLNKFAMAELLPVQLLTMVQVADIFCPLTGNEKLGLGESG